MSTLCQVLKMQLYALDSSGRRIFAAVATPSKDYVCQECRQAVRARKSKLGRFHFFHLFRSQRCRGSKKSLSHIAVQNYVQKAIGEDRCQQEVSFPKIGRIADLVWEEKKLVIEIQCSPITRQEVEKRSQDYASLGFSVIWILSDKTFNQPNISPAEKFLEKQTHYFVWVDEDVVHSIYDQYARRKEPLPIDITTLSRNLLKTVKNRSCWEYHAYQDVIWHIAKKTSKGLFYLKALQSGKREGNYWLERFEYVLKLRFFRCIWNLIIENACR
jgi:competence CoiA-like predicted nuclease